MNSKTETEQKSGFGGLTPDVILNLVEDWSGKRLTNLCRPLNSYINRVYELEDENGDGLVVKFFRPGRWSEKALLEEHQFMAELLGNEVPVIAPLRLQEGKTLGCHDNIFFALFPKKGGRFVDELNDEQWVSFGRLLGRVHLIGRGRSFSHRPILRPDKSTVDHLRFILASGLLPEDQKKEYTDIVNRFVDKAAPLFTRDEYIRVHGDCHWGNLIFRPDEGFFLIDFDDMAMGPPLQDFWMLLPGNIEDTFVEIDLFLEGYETFSHFDYQSLQLVEPLRAMRFIHYTAWCAYQVLEDGHSEVVPDFGTQEYWRKEIADIRDQLDLMDKPAKSMGNML